MTATGLDRVHDRLDGIAETLTRIQLDTAVMRSENAAIGATVAALGANAKEHDARIAALEHDRSRAFGVLAGVGTASAAGGVGLGAVFRLFGLVP